MGTGPDTGLGHPVTTGQGPGWTQLAQAVAADVPPEEIAGIYVFRPYKRDGREWGTAVVTRHGDAVGGRLRVYTARYMLITRGKERGRAKVEVQEVALSPAEVLAHVMQETVDRTGDPEPPATLERTVWFPDSDTAQPHSPSRGTAR
ncbi:MAG TPA: hypothetical protein VN848_01360 [Gemmatimonadales bacterium]|nr:hypothetical protein [Gemmatimonadales bacterium]